MKKEENFNEDDNRHLVQPFGFRFSWAASLLEVIVVALLLLEVLLASRTRQQLGPAGSDLEKISDMDIGMQC